MRTRSTKDRTRRKNITAFRMPHINELRTQVRQVERYAVDEFCGDRDDIIAALNRLSSYVYVILLELMKEREETL